MKIKYQSGGQTTPKVRGKKNLIEDLKQYLERVLVTLYKSKISGDKFLPLLSVAGKRDDFSYRKYLIVDFYTWLEVLKESQELQKYTPESRYFLNVASKYKSFIEISSKRISLTTGDEIIASERERKLCNELSSMLITKEFLTAYTKFVSLMEEVQIYFYSIYGPNNNSTNPVTIIPWSYGINRCANELFIITDSESEAGSYDISVNEIKDIGRISVPSKIKLVHYDIDTTVNIKLPVKWKTLFKVVKEGLVTYPPRLEMVNESFSQHCFYGYKYIPALEEEVFLLNFPMLLSAAKDTPMFKVMQVNELNRFTTDLEDNILLEKLE